MYLGPSVRENQPYETLCQFKDDEYPLLDTYRSSARKTLICRSQDWKTTIESFLSIICAKYLHEGGYIAIKVVIGPHFFSFSKKKYFIFKDFFFRRCQVTVSWKQVILVRAMAYWVLLTPSVDGSKKWQHFQNAFLILFDLSVVNILSS